MPVLRNIRHEKFARAYLKLEGDGAKAYRSVYPNGQGRNVAKQNAWQLLNYNRKVRSRIRELRRQMIRRSDITIERILTDYEEAKQMAKAQGKGAEIVNAATAQAKLVGLLRDRVEAGNVGDFDNMDNISEVLERVAAEAGPEAALALSKAFGLERTSEAPIELEKPSEADLEGAKPASDAVN